MSSVAANENLITLKIESIKPETADAATFYLKEVNGRKIAYKAGQFITLIFNHQKEEIRRSYSLSSSPDEELLAITIKRVQNGEISRYLLAYAKTGDTLTAVLPAGRFTLDQHEDKKHLFYFAAGSGITPIFSQLKYLLSRPDSSKITLFYSNQNASSVLFGNELEQLAQQSAGRLEILNLLSSKAKRLNNIMVEQLVKQFDPAYLNDAEFYLCGPFTYMRMIRLTLLYMGIQATQIHRETFVLETVPVTSALKTFSPHRLQLFFKSELHDIMAGENQSILQAALQNNIHLPYSCANGVCASCAALCKRGKVEMVKNEVLTDAEIKQGWVLTCTGYALTDDVLIEYPTS